MSFSFSFSKRARALIALCVALSALMAFASPAKADHRRKLRFMTRNLYLGAPLGPIFASATPEQLVANASATWAQVKASDFPGRAEELANELAEEMPDLVGLQEVTLYRSGAFNDPARATTVELDFLDELMDEVDERDLPYEVVAQVSAFDGELPVIDGAVPKDLRLTDRDVILARTDLSESRLTLFNPRSGLYNAKLTIPNPLFPGGGLPIDRGWVSVEVRSRGKEFRFINTHLEAFSDEAQEAQSLELLAGPAATSKPVVMTGDFNSAADGSGSDSYANIVNAGFTDAWSEVFPSNPGYTCCHSDDLMSAAGDLTTRIDLIFYRGGSSFKAIAAEIVGEEEADKTTSGLWPSDHAGVLSTIEFGPAPHLDH